MLTSILQRFYPFILDELFFDLLIDLFESGIFGLSEEVTPSSLDIFLSRSLSCLSAKESP